MHASRAHLRKDALNTTIIIFIINLNLCPMQTQSSAIQSSLYYHAVTFWTVRLECVAEISKTALTKPSLVCIGKEQTEMVVLCKRSKMSCQHSSIHSLSSVPVSVQYFHGPIQYSTTLLSVCREI